MTISATKFQVLISFMNIILFLKILKKSELEASLIKKGYSFLTFMFVSNCVKFLHFGTKEMIAFCTFNALTNMLLMS